MEKITEYLVFGYDSPKGEERIYEMGDLRGARYQARYLEGYDWGGYSLHRFDSLEEAVRVFPEAEVITL